MEKEKEINAMDIIDIVLEVLNRSHGNLGYTGFRLHSIKPNGAKDTYFAKYSFIPRDGDNKRQFFEAKIDIKTKTLISFNEISEEKLLKNDN